MPITFKVASHDANEYKRYGEINEMTAADALNQVWHPPKFKVKGALLTGVTARHL
jgi:hypothetical protein